MSKYSPLANHLAALQATEARMSFGEIEMLINDRLPPSARTYPAWWGNADRGKNGWSNLWKRAGWVRTQYSLPEEWVTFQRPEHYEPDSEGAREGYEIDRRILTTSRNAGLADRRRRMDKYTCQACSFRCEILGKFVIDVRHLNPLGTGIAGITTIDKLISLCPICHRIAHLRKPPYEPEEIKALRSKGEANA